MVKEPCSLLGGVMDQDSIVRAANPTFSEGLVFARYLVEITEGFFRYMLGRRAVDIIATAYTQPDNDLSHQNTIFAERDGVIVGMASGYTAEQHRRFSDQPLKRAAGRSAMRMASFTVLCAPLLRALGTHADGDFYLHHIAVDKELRGQGVGSTLLYSIENRARVSGSARLSLDVAAKNEGARRLYERFGLTVASGWPNLPLVPKVLFRMTKPI